MGLVVCLLGGLFLSIIGVDSFMWSLWVLGLGALFSSLMLFNNVGVECISEMFWSNGFSCILVSMTLWVGGACFLCTNKIGLGRSRKFSICLLSLCIISVGFFLASSWFSLFFFFEASLIPISTLILSWGYQPERLQAAGYMMMYTVCASLPLLGALTWVFWEVGSVSLYVKSYVGVPGVLGGDEALFVCILIAFLVKSPIFMVHGWLPKAHVEAPVAGSMMLAGVLLKFGGYGCLLCCYYFLPVGMVSKSLAMSLIIWGGVLCGIMCLRQLDIKALIAYSSIGHMALCLGGFMTCYSMGWKGGLILMVAHGLCSPGLFALAGFVYVMFSSRSFVLCKGVLSVVPALSLAWFLFCSSNMAFPPSASLLGEVMLIVSLVSYYCWFMVPLGLMVFITGVYCMVLYSSIQHGSVSGLVGSGVLVGSSFMTMSWILWVPLNLLVGCSDIVGSGF